MRREPKPAEALAKANRAPKEGTKLRQVYDALKAAPGKSVLIDFVEDRALLYRQLQQLRDFYGLDIQNVPTGPKHRHTKYEHVLVGEHIGKDYVSYVDAAG